MGVDSEMMRPIHFHNDLVIFNQNISREEAIISDALNVGVISSNIQRGTTRVVAQSSVCPQDVAHVLGVVLANALLQCIAESCKETNSTAEYGSHVPATTAGTEADGMTNKDTATPEQAEGGKGPQRVGQVLTVAGVQGSHSQAGCIRQQISGWAPGQLGKGPQGMWLLADTSCVDVYMTVEQFASRLSLGPTWVVTQGGKRPQHILDALRSELAQLVHQLTLQHLEQHGARVVV
ncbi:MAG: hypothetical protein FRX49_01724 [Trebouxia sp. A1-2]|nr:MAG: hypothetical protein FRX49_01724 [Trebouxia sp. A1-2]